MQHLVCNYREEGIANEVSIEDLLHQSGKREMWDRWQAQTKPPGNLLPAYVGRELQKYLLTILLAALGTTPLLAMGAEIYKCSDEDGNVAYLQLPCPATAVETAELDEGAIDELEISPPPAPSSRLSGESLGDCKKRYRDQIDEIDAELSSTYSAEQIDAHKEELLALVRQLRACG